MDLNQPWVTATYGNTEDPYAGIGIVEGRHTVISRPGFDENTGMRLKFLPEGVSKVIRLGNAESHGEAESITYRFKVDRDRPILLLNFAVVLEDPLHELSAQPRFVMQVLDRNGRLLESCTEYDVSAREGIDGFHTYLRNLYIPVRWRDWTSVGTDLSAYAGEEVQVRFTTYDCEFLGHFGYAYFYVSCISARLSVSGCEADGFELAAPDHFASYEWNNGQTERISHWPREEEIPPITCEVTSVTGCRFSLYSTVAAPGDMPAGDMLVFDTICEGENYEKHGLKLPSLERSGTYTHTFVDVSDCDATREVTTTLALHVVKRYLRIEDWICEGEGYDREGFHFDRLAAGDYRDTLQISVMGRCGAFRVLDLHVASNRMTPHVLVGETSPCDDKISEYRDSRPERGDRYEWEYPEGTFVRGNKTLPEIALRFPATGKVDTLKLRVVNGCKMTEAVLPLTVSPAYHEWYKDSVCTGLPYRKRGFQIAPKEIPGSYTEVIYGKTVKRCDSILVLNLEVFDSPKVKIGLEDSVFCVPEFLTMTAQVTESHRDIGAGDVLCEDGAVVSVEEYKKGGRVAKGIVFWVDSSGRHGWAVDVEEFPEQLRWTVLKDLPSPRYNIEPEALKDLNGEENTRKIRELGLVEGSPVFKALSDKGEEWYLPALGQLDLLWSSYPLINRALGEVGGVPLRLAENTQYWSSSLYGIWELWVWAIVVTKSNGIRFTQVPMVAPCYVRGVCNF